MKEFKILFFKKKAVVQKGKDAKNFNEMSDFDGLSKAQEDGYKVDRIEANSVEAAGNIEMTATVYLSKEKGAVEVETTEAEKKKTTKS